jgi:ABC-2 type transport system permease protein
MNIFLHELKSYRNSIIIWSISLTLFALMYIFIFIGISPDIESFKSVLLSMPEMVRKLLSIYVESISTLEGFYSFVFVYIVLCAAIQAMNLGISIISKEIRDKTADFLLTKPVSRKNILTAKLLAALTSLIITNAIYLFITITSTAFVKTEFNMKIFVMISITMFFVQLIFASLGVIIAVVVGKIKSVISISLSTVFGFFFVSMLGSIFGDEAIRYLSPFKYFDLAYIVKNGAYEVQFIIIGLVVVILSMTASYWVYLKKDVHSV